MDAEMTRDLEVLRSAVDDLAILGRCLSIGDDIERWNAGDRIAGAVAADGLDQALGLLHQLHRSRAQSVAEAVERLIERLPAPPD